MDTIIRENPQTLCIEHAVLPSAVPKLTFYQRVVTRTVLRFESFVERVICCVPNNIVEDWEYDVVVRQTVKAMQYDDVEFSELVEVFNAATVVEETSEQEMLFPMGVEMVEAARGDELPSEQAGVSPVEGVESAVNDGCESPNEQVGVSPLVEVEATVPMDASVVRLSRGVRTRRRRKRVVAFVVVALINKVRCKYYQMDDSTANRRLVGSYLLKLMREHNFRTSDIHPHVDYAVDLYFALRGEDLKPTVYARQ